MKKHPQIQDIHYYELEDIFNMLIRFRQKEETIRINTRK